LTGDAGDQRALLLHTSATCREDYRSLLDRYTAKQCSNISSFERRAAHHPLVTQRSDEQARSETLKCGAHRRVEEDGAQVSAPSRSGARLPLGLVTAAWRSPRRRAGVQCRRIV
jgi:hypothetical protein